MAAAPSGQYPLSETTRLALAAQAGDSRALTELLARYEPLCAAAAARLNVPGMERADLQQSARLCLTRAVAAFDPARGSWGSLVKTSIRRCLVTELERSLRACRWSGAPALSLESLAETEDDREPVSGEDVEREAVERLHQQEVAAAVDALVDDGTDRLILHAIREGLSLAEIAPEAGLTPQALGRRRERLLARLRSQLTFAGFEPN